MEFLCQDLIRDIAINLNLNDVLSFSTTNNFIFSTLDDFFYKILAYKTWSHLFWRLAQLRNKNISKPLPKWKYELIRIENYQVFLEKNNIKRWTQKDFYNYWKFDYFTRNI